MEAVQTRAARQPLSALARLTLGTLVATAAIFATLWLAIFKGGGPPLLPPIVLLLVAAAVIPTGRRWAPLVGATLLALIAAGLILPTMGMIVQEITTPGMPMGPLLLLLLPTMLVGAAVGMAATVQNYRRAPAERRAPRWMAPALWALAGLAIGAAGLHMVAAGGGGAGVSKEMLATLPAVVTKEFAFEQEELRVRAGELVALRLSNADQIPHSFDVDEFDVHVMMPAGEDAVALFRPSEPGSYTFYCAPHYDKATGEGMKGTLIVE